MLKADLHVHSKYSNHPSEWFLQRLGASESYTEPEFIYRSAKEKGMDFVTVPDHNRAEAALLLREKYSHDVFTGVESTASFPEDGCKDQPLIQKIPDRAEGGRSLAFMFYKIAYDFSQKKRESPSTSFLGKLTEFVFERKGLGLKNRLLLRRARSSSRKDGCRFYRLLAARLLNIKSVGIYHTDYTGLAQKVIPDESVAQLLENLTRAFYSAMDEIRVPTREYIQILASRGFSPAKMRIFRRGIDALMFSPQPKARERIQKRYALADGLNLLYVGRVSEEKDLDFLLQVHRALLEKGKRSTS